MKIIDTLKELIKPRYLTQSQIEEINLAAKSLTLEEEIKHLKELLK